tara:strand:+ start:88 stop:945 length:858 start_codon:yes stop_codon:yes gene_type:complete
MANDSKNGIRSLVREPDALQTALYGSREEALRQRKLQEDMVDIEFMNEVNQAMGPYGSQDIDPSRAVTVPTGKWRYSIGGLYAPPDEGDWEKGRKRREDRYGQIFEGTGIDITPDTVYAIGGDQAAPRLWAHEFRHRSINKSSPLWKDEERWNIIFDAWRARTPEEWQSAIDSWQVQNPKSNKGEIEYLTNEETEDHLKKIVNANVDTLINLEIQARKGMRQRMLDELKEKNISIPDIPEFDEDKEKNRLIKQANSRALSVGRDELELTGKKTLYEKFYEILERD